MANNRRRDILRRAAELFASHGVSRTSMEDIASAVGIKREGVYYYFKSRNDILLEIILPQSKSLLLALRRLVRASMAAPLKLRSAIEVHLDAYSPSYIEMSVALKEQHFDMNDNRMNELRAVWSEYGTLWTEIIREGQAQGEFKPDINPRIVAFGLLGMCNWVSRWYDPDKSITIRDITETFASIATTGTEVPPVRHVRSAK